MSQDHLLELHTRVLVVFSWDRRKSSLSDILAQLAEVKWNGKRCWTSPSPPGAYRTEYASLVQQYLFPECPNQGDSLRAYIRLDPDVHNRVFGNFIAVDYDLASGRAERRPSTKALCPAKPGIEAFLHSDGSGVLSLTFGLCEDRGTAISFDLVRRFNYALSQNGRRNIAHLRRPHPDLDPHMFGQDVSPPPIPKEEDLTKRLGQFGCSFSIDELASFLLAPVFAAPGFFLLQKQNSVYSVGLFQNGTPFDSSAQSATDFLAAIAQIEEPGHPGTPIDVTKFTSHHWAASSTLASAHLATNQGVPFDEQRAAILRDKYFVSYLVALHQRATLYRMHLLSTGLIGVPDHSRHEVSELRRGALHFLLVGDWTEISSRDVINRYYEQCRRALRIGPSLATVTTAIAELDALERSDLQQQSLDALRLSQHGQHKTLIALEHTQNKLEWIEILIVGIYLAEFVHLVCEALHLPGMMTMSSIIASAVLGIWIAYWVLRPNATGDHANLTVRRNTAVTVSSICLSAWLVGSMFWRQQELTDLHRWCRSLEQRLDLQDLRGGADQTRERALRRIETLLTTARGDLSLHRVEPAHGALSEADERIREVERRK